MKPAIVMGDVTALGILVGAATNVLPALAALLGVVWYAILIYDRLRNGPKKSADDDGL